MYKKTHARRCRTIDCNTCLRQSHAIAYKLYIQYKKHAAAVLVQSYFRRHYAVSKSAKSLKLIVVPFALGNSLLPSDLTLNPKRSFLK